MYYIRNYQNKGNYHYDGYKEKMCKYLHHRRSNTFLQGIVLLGH